MIQAAQPRRFLENLQVFDAGKPLMGDLYGDLSMLLYAANPVYLDVSQGRSMLADRALTIFLLLPLLLIPTSVFAIELFFSMALPFKMERASIITLFLLVPIMLAILLVSVFLLVAFFRGFSAPIDNIVRFDRKRQMVYVMKEKREGLENIRSLKDLLEIGKDKKVFLEIPWKDLAPALHRRAVGGVMGHLHSAMLLAFDPKINGEKWQNSLRRKEGAPYLVRVGHQHGSGVFGDATVELQAMLPLEAIRRFMEEGYGAWIRPKKWRRLYRPDWRHMLTFHDPLEQDGVEEENSTGWKVFDYLMNVLLIPFLIIPFCFNWLTMRFAPKPKFPENIEGMHQEDLKELGLNEYGEPLQRQETILDQTRPKRNFFWLFDKGVGISLCIIMLIAAPLCITVSFSSPTDVQPKRSHYSHWKNGGVTATAPVQPKEKEFPYSLSLFELLSCLFAVSGMVVGIATVSLPLVRKVNPDAVAWIKANPVPESEQDPWLTRMDIAGFSVPVRVHAVMEDGTKLA